MTALPSKKKGWIPNYCPHGRVKKHLLLNEGQHFSFWELKAEVDHRHRQYQPSLPPVSSCLSSQYLLLVLVFSSCSFCLEFHSSSSSLAFSFHSASCLRELSSGAREDRVNGSAGFIMDGGNDDCCVMIQFHTHTGLKCWNQFCSAYRASPAALFAPPSTCVGFQAQPEAGLRWRLQHRHLTDRCFPEKREKWHYCVI